jgi:hypothetical protein
MKPKTPLNRSFLLVLFVLKMSILAEPLLLTFYWANDSKAVAVLDLDWNNDTDEKEDQQEKDKINAPTLWLKTNRNMPPVLANFNLSEKLFRSPKLKVISPPPEQA